MEIKKILNLLVISSKNIDKKIVEFFSNLNKYFLIDITYINHDELYKIDKNVVYNYVIVENINKNNYDEDFYQKINELFKNFHIFWLIKKYSEKDVFFLKYLNNDILYFNEDYETFRITNLSILNREWESFEVGNSIAHRGLFLDFVHNKIYLNNKILKLTKKEFLVLVFLLVNRNLGSIDKNRIFQFVWDIDNDTDKSRVVDQIVHKLRKKINGTYFETVLGKGIKLI